MLPYLPVHLRFLLKKPGVLVRQDFVLPAQVSRLRRDILPVSVNMFSRFLTSTDGRPASSWSSLLRSFNYQPNKNALWGNPAKLLYIWFQTKMGNLLTPVAWDWNGLKMSNLFRPSLNFLVVAVCSSWGSPWSPQHGTFVRTRDTWPVQLSGAPAVRVSDWSNIA